MSTPAGARPRPGLVLALLCTVQFILVLDSAIANVALPPIRSDLGFSVGALQYVVSLYALTFGGFLILAGRAGDLFGRRRFLVAGLAVFTAASLVCGLAQTEGALLAGRALQGLGGALAAPAALSLITTTFAARARPSGELRGDPRPGERRDRERQERAARRRTRGHGRRHARAERHRAGRLLARRPARVRDVSASGSA